MKKDSSKKSKGLEKELKAKLVEAIQTVIAASNKEISDKIVKTIGRSSRDIAKKYVKVLKKNIRKSEKAAEKAAKKQEVKKVPSTHSN